VLARGGPESVSAGDATTALTVIAVVIASWLAVVVTAVNWEREPGEKIEEFVAAMLLLDHPHGNLITPSRGDRGVDIRVEHPDGFDIYQVKRYARPLNSRQAAEITKSWQTFVGQSLPRLRVRSWNLVTPWNPSNERLEWLESLTAGHGVPVIGSTARRWTEWRRGTHGWWTTTSATGATGSFS